MQSERERIAKIIEQCDMLYHKDRLIDFIISEKAKSKAEGVIETVDKFEKLDEWCCYRGENMPKDCATRECYLCLCDKLKHHTEQSLGDGK